MTWIRLFLRRKFLWRCCSSFQVLMRTEDWRLTYGQRFWTTNPISKESLMKLICNLLARFTETSLNCSAEPSSWSCWDTSADPNTLVQHRVCAAACRYMISDTHLATTLHCERSRVPDCRQRLLCQQSSERACAHPRLRSAANLSS